jgi:hypothetical protein
MSMGWTDGFWSWHSQYDSVRCGRPLEQARLALGRRGPRFERRFEGCAVAIDRDGGNASIIKTGKLEEKEH